MYGTQTRKPYPFLNLEPSRAAARQDTYSPISLSIANALPATPKSASSLRTPLSPRSPGFTRMLHKARSLTSFGGKKSRRGVDSGIASRIPPELWLKVFVCIPLFQLPAVTLTCRTFWSLAQPLLFSTVSTHPAELPSLPLRGPQVVKYRKRIIDHVDFFFSPRIAPSVHECCIAPPSSDQDGASSDDLIDTIFDSLPLLPNLKILNCRCIRLTPRRLAVLQNLQLTAVSLEMCFGEMTDFAAGPSVALKTVTFKYPDESLRWDESNPCLFFLSPQHLERLHATTTSVLPVVSKSEPFRKLHTLELPIECIVNDEFMPALAQCPAVEHLSLHTHELIPRSLIESLPEGILPLLSSYSGPHHYAAPFLRNRPAKNVDISLRCNPARLEASLKGIDRTLASLSFSLDGTELPAPLFGTIHASFPALKSLAVSGPALSSADMNNVLGRVPAHYTLQELTLRIQGRDKFNLWIPPEEAAADAASCFKKMLPALLRTYPSLRAVRLLYGQENGWAMWRRSSGSGLFVKVSA
ncbi:hypothetical protein MKEN_01234600 [Mycena kentingensis (nom. inval.)]|nr:hypothetical protein MKEN_01234600 [Mycena kentingensis (nom. inval.)]